MYTLKSIARRSTSLTAVIALLVATVVPAVLPALHAYADALNPLTERSLTLSSSSPGWSYTDGSGNSTYAPPNSGANGKKTGETFSFKVSTDSSASGTDTALKAFSFQYCKASAGLCYSPVNNTGTITPLEIVAPSASEISSATWDIIKPGGTGRAEVPAIAGAGGTYNGLPKMDGSEGNFVVLVNGSYSANWAMAASNVEAAAGVDTPTGKNNYITLVNTGTGEKPTTGSEIKVVFFGNDNNYITNPGGGAFFVKINDYTAFTGDGSSTPYAPDTATLVDGGVTVANVMNQSIEIQTKVLETMDFSVGTVDPTTLSSAQLAAATSPSQSAHAPCDPILTGMTAGGANPNVLKMGDQAGENSLSTQATYGTHSYWRLSSNSSAGATVYYSGVTLSNTVGDQIDPINGGNGVATTPVKGSEQFGLALDNGDGSDVSGNVGWKVNYTTETLSAKGLYEDGADTAATGLAALNNASPSGDGVDASTIADLVTNFNASYHRPQLYPLVPLTDYQYGSGYVNASYNPGSGTQAQFAFDKNSNTIPTPIAKESSQVVDCVTGKMRYIANIAATTPAGIYTTKINYIAAPQY